jgi:hypothetical protein
MVTVERHLTEEQAIASSFENFHLNTLLQCGIITYTIIAVHPNGTSKTTLYTGPENVMAELLEQFEDLLPTAGFPQAIDQTSLFGRKM